MQLEEDSLILRHVGGERLRGHWRDAGSSPVGIFLPGFASHMGGSKSLLLARFAQQQGWSWLRFDYRGVGESDGAFAELTLSRYLEDLALVLDFLQDRPVLLVGSSLGGWVAALAGVRWPQRIRALLLIAPAFNFIPLLFAALPAAEQEQWRETGLRRWRDPYGLGELEMRYDLVADSTQYDLFREPPSYPFPVHILHGSADEAVPLQRSFDFAARAQAKPLCVEHLPGIDHRLQGADTALLRASLHLYRSVVPHRP
ncbi:MAG: alpha/beta hydrolase [Acidithiobacillus sp.]